MQIYSTAVVTVLALMLSSISWATDFAKGQEAYYSGDYETALAEWQPLAEEGQADSQFGMGLLYANGFGVPFDNHQSLVWYGLAAAQGHGEAQCNLAVMHANGWGVPQSDDEAFKWYSMAADLGVLQAQNSLAKMYSRGFGTPKDYVQAYKWFAVASELGDYGAPFKRDELAERMSAEEITESNNLAGVWMESHQSLTANH